MKKNQTATPPAPNHLQNSARRHRCFTAATNAMLDYVSSPAYNFFFTAFPKRTLAYAASRFVSHFFTLLLFHSKHYMEGSRQGSIFKLTSHSPALTERGALEWKENGSEGAGCKILHNTAGAGSFACLPFHSRTTGEACKRTNKLKRSSCLMGSVEKMFNLSFAGDMGFTAFHRRPLDVAI